MKRVLLRSVSASSGLEELTVDYREAVEEAIRLLQEADDLGHYVKRLDARSAGEDLAFADGTLWYFVRAADREGKLTPAADYAIDREESIVTLVMLELEQGHSPLPIFRLIAVLTAMSRSDTRLTDRLAEAMERYRRSE